MEKFPILTMGRTTFLAVFLLATTTANGQYAGADACKSCHPNQYALQSQSGHGKALSGGPTHWNFGAGVQAITPVSKLNDEFYLEHGQSDFKGVKDRTPGHTTSKGVQYRITDPGSQIMKCFQCHSTGPLNLSASLSIEPSEHGVRCESCHGPGTAHIEQGGSKTAIFNPSQLNASAMNEFCGNCHRKPGEDTDWTKAWNTRHQPIYLNQSTCFQKSNGALNCITCHKPHESLVRTGSALTRYDAICSSCHAKPNHKAIAVAGKTCTSCHMPQVRPQARLAFTNHWIGIYRKGNLRP